MSMRMVIRDIAAKSPVLVATAIFVLAGLAALGIAIAAVRQIEAGNERGVAEALAEAGHSWAEPQADGLKLRLHGTAPHDTARFAALRAASAVVDPKRLRDRIEVVPPESPEPPRHSIELLRNGGTVSMIGLVPERVERAGIIARIEAIPGINGVVDMTGIASHAPRPGWEESVDFTITALGLVKDSKISVEAGAVSIAAIADGQAEKMRLVEALRRLVPRDLDLRLDISAPRPVITPFALEFVLQDGTARLGPCAADSDEARARILAAARAAGATGEAECSIGLGAPTPDWGPGVAAAIGTLADLGGGRLRISDADLRLEAPAGTPQQAFDAAVRGLRRRLPDVFSVSAVLPERPESHPAPGAQNDADLPEFVATRSPEGLVQLRGLVTDPALREAVASFARARFGGEGLHDTLRTDDTLPEGWSVRVLAGLEGLAMLASGSLVVTPDSLALRGLSDAPERAGQVAELLARMLPEEETPVLEIAYSERLDPIANRPEPAECMARIGAILEEGQIVFAPGEAALDAAAGEVVDRIAEVLRGDCAEVEMQIEIGGHTDSQGRAGMNRALSQARAEAVLDGLLARGVLTSNMTARGYGSERPVADNATEEGREANRRIEFRLLREAQAEAVGAAADIVSGGPRVTPPDERPGNWIRPQSRAARLDGQTTGGADGPE